MSRWVIPNEGYVTLILDTPLAKADMLQALECAAKAGQLRGDLDTFKTLLASQIELEAALAKAAA